MSDNGKDWQRHFTCYHYYVHDLGYKARNYMHLCSMKWTIHFSYKNISKTEYMFCIFRKSVNFNQVWYFDFGVTNKKCLYSPFTRGIPALKQSYAVQL